MAGPGDEQSSTNVQGVTGVTPLEHEIMTRVEPPFYHACVLLSETAQPVQPAQPAERCRTRSPSPQRGGQAGARPGRGYIRTRSPPRPSFAEHERVKRDLAAHTRELASALAITESQRGTIAALEQQRALAGARTAELEEVVICAQERARTANRELKKLHAELKGRSAAQAESEANLDTALASILAAHADLAAKEAENARLRADLAAKEAENEGLRPKPCSVCLDRPSTHAAARCGHVCLCEACAGSLFESGAAGCPYCREPSNSAPFRLYYP